MPRPTATPCCSARCPFAINRFLFTTLGYDSFTDFAPVTLLATYPDLMAVPNTSPAKIGRRVHRLCEGERRQDDVLVVRHRHLDRISPASCSSAGPASR